MATYWHVTGADYEDGDDLLTRQEAELQGRVAPWRWSHEPTPDDYQAVSLFADHADAERWIAEGFAPAGHRLLRVEIPAHEERAIYPDPYEGHPVYPRSIPADWIEAV